MHQANNLPDIYCFSHFNFNLVLNFNPFFNPFSIHLQSIYNPFTIYFQSIFNPISTFNFSSDLWEGGRLPCPGQSMVLPQEVVSVPGNFSFGSKVFLPENGMLLFPQEGLFLSNFLSGHKCHLLKSVK